MTAAVLVAGLLGAGFLAGCGPTTVAGPAPGGRVRVVAAENQYGDVASQIGGQYVAVRSVVQDPNTDPHTYEVSPKIAAAVDTAAVVIQNGLGYDSFMNTIEAASARPGRRVIVAQKLLHLPGDTANPHLWYDPRTMPLVAAALASDLSALQPDRAGYFSANLARFDASLDPWRVALAQLGAARPGFAVAATEPVAGYLVQAAGGVVLTPMSFQTDIMNGVDPPPQGVTLERDLLVHRRVAALVYNRQVTDSVTAGFVSEARAAGVPVVAAYETMPEPGYDYQSWMLAETRALTRAVTAGQSTGTL
ncbi:MAG: zinc ABC transporter substrate-binding protein [Actinomycetota bacterium]|nr:zinc ABC transporter substrate-binding protein [Actinomycetota bacterium]